MQNKGKLTWFDSVMINYTTLNFELSVLYDFRLQENEITSIEYLYWYHKISYSYMKSNTNSISYFDSLFLFFTFNN